MSQSGLRALTRDWSSSSTDTELYSWPPTSQTQSAPAPTPTLTAKEQRMRAIQAGLSQPQGAGPLFSSSSKKRSSDGADNLEPPAKKRLMPWNTLSLDGKDEDPTEEKPATSMGAPVSQRGTAKVFLSQEQKHILKLVTHGSNIFYTGSAGTGKSVLLREIIRALKQKFTTALDAVAITASTGIAACNIGGVTLHSFGGIGIGVETAEQLANKIRKNKKATGRWLRTKVLIIDEGPFSAPGFLASPDSIQYPWSTVNCSIN
ncbi:hypothetical protein SISSUDRAFT_784647 [Sistotremastrum suecicum HHB10207 ss-3]|uniref:ATP-dependent DNA helicase n=1 Tax=Sistotremastrum suecicum HHB10207 ss-3 TaxID=1314776 RepID=A0A166D2Z3_9AGAM|nr:hypothetical protein SISSUDRAFT_784647 [Sistotremastrum suecicum HHB10207 ss-3]